MKIIYSAMLALTMGVASISSVQARDSFSIGVNIGGYGYAPPAVYYPAPAVVYYDEPVYYRPAPRYYGYAPTVISFGYQGYGGHHYRGHHGGHHYRGHDGGHQYRGHGGGHQYRGHDGGHQYGGHNSGYSNRHGNRHSRGRDD